MLANPRAEIEAVIWWLVERFPDPDDLGAVFARARAFEDILFDSEVASLLRVKGDVESRHWHPRMDMAA
ncbi:MAG: hypothetical protein JWQ03_3210 [Variovorax sp.]|nr:hypothetical protein [Variovorax sp.]